MVESSLFIFAAGKTPSESENTVLQLTLSVTKANIHLQSINRDTDIENKHMGTRGGDGISWEAGIDTCIHYWVTVCDPMDGSPLSMGFLRQEHWSGLSRPLSEDLPNPGFEPRSPALQVDSLPAEPLGNPKNIGMGSLSLFKWIFPTQESNPGLSRILAWVAHLFSRVSSLLRDWTRISCIVGGYFTSWDTRETPNLSLKAVLRITFLLLFSLRSKSTYHLDKTSLASWVGFTFPSWTDLGEALTFSLRNNANSQSWKHPQSCHEHIFNHSRKIKFCISLSSCIFLIFKCIFFLIRNTCKINW